ncbi:MAG: hypothetical protein J3R72DRAFT_534 [Linnemannia gamsii]|nr:MAG: hypothetical protein J3R72DRAFT_534 [Linnemannia gamsii]
MSAAAPTEPKINNPHRVQVLVDFPDPTITVATAEPIAFPGRRRKFIAVADGDKSFFALKDVITTEFHRLYAEEAPYGLCQLKNWNYCRIPERYLVRDVLGKDCDIYVTRELLSTKKMGKSIKRKVDADTSSSASSSSSSSSSASSASVPAAGPSTPTPKSKKHKKEAAAAPAAAEVKPKAKAILKKETVAAPAAEVKPKAKTSVKKEAAAAAPKDAVKEKAAQSTFDGLTEEQIMKRISTTSQERKKASAETTPEAASSSSSSPAVAAASTPKKQKNAKKVDTAVTPAAASTPAKATPKATPKAAAEIKANKKVTPPKDTKEKSEEDIMKEISANFKVQKTKGDIAETVRKAEEIKVATEVSENHVAAADAKKVEPKKERAKKTKAATANTDTKETKVTEGTAKETKAAKPKAKETKVTEGATKAKKAAAPAKESSESATPAPPKAKKVVRKEAESDATSESTPVAKKGATRRTPEDEERLHKLAEQDPTTWTEEERHEVKLHKKRLAARELHEQQRQARIDAESSDPEIAAAAKLLLEPRPRGRPPVKEKSPREVIQKFIQEKKVDDEKNDGESSTSSSPEVEAHVKVERPVKAEPRPAVRLALPPSFGTDSDSSSDSD